MALNLAFFFECLCCCCCCYYLISLSFHASGATRYLKWPDVMFCIAAGHAIAASATSQKPVRLSCWGNRDVKWASVFSGNIAMDALDTKFIVNSLNDIVFDVLSVRKI